MSWVRIEKPREIIGYQNGVPVAVLDLQVSTAGDLPSIGDNVGGYIVAAGTISQLVQAGGFVTLDATDAWYDTAGNEVG